MNKSTKPTNILSMFDKRAYGSIIIISTMVSILSLIVPIAAQMLVNIVAFARLYQPIVVISIVVFAILIGTAILSVWQHRIVEMIQQKLFAEVVISSARKLPFLHPRVYTENRGPDLVNQFFDVITIQKSLADILIYGLNAIISALFGMILLALYHPYFLVFDLVLIVMIFLAFYLPYSYALQMAKKECSEKHRIASWLEEVIANPYLFMFNNHEVYALQEADNRLVSYLQARGNHFRMIVRHIAGTHMITALATCALLGLGGYLVIQNKLSLGQLVAAEIVLSSLTFSFKHLSVLLKDYYDMVASADKVNNLLNLDQENQNKASGTLELMPVPETMNIRLVDFCPYDAPDLKPLSIEARPGAPLCFSIDALAHAVCFIENVSGFNCNFKGNLELNCLKTNHHIWFQLRPYVTRLKRLEMFTGTIEENLLMGREVTTDELYHLLGITGLQEVIQNLPDGLQTKIVATEVQFSLAELKMMMLVRTLLIRPKLLILEEFIDSLSEEQIETVVHCLSMYQDMTIVVMSQQSRTLSHFRQSWENSA